MPNPPKTQTTKRCFFCGRDGTETRKLPFFRLDLHELRCPRNPNRIFSNKSIKMADFIDKMTSVARDKWNANCDAFNSWGALSEEEKTELIEKEIKECQR
jgi:hypothetical protein